MSLRFKAALVALFTTEEIKGYQDTSDKDVIKKKKKNGNPKIVLLKITETEKQSSCHATQKTWIQFLISSHSEEDRWTNLLHVT